MPDDAEAHNRLGKALTELGQITEARNAYTATLEVDPANLIAQRNLDFLSRLTDAEAAELAAKAGDKLPPRFFMEETGKTQVSLLETTGSTDVLATLTAGDRVQLQLQNGRLVVLTPNGQTIGTVEQRLGARLARLMETGNEYQAGVVGVDNGDVRIIIRETVQSPQNTGRISFPPRVEATLPRPYLREGLVRRGAAVDDVDDEDLDIDMRDEGSEDDEDEAHEFGFHEGELDET
jgi:hypothetical protein